jgi:hypothetical protein
MVVALVGACTRESPTESSPQDSPKSNAAASAQARPPADPPAPDAPAEPVAEVPTGPIVSAEGADKGCDLMVELGKTGMASVQPDKTYCVLGARLKSTNTMKEVRAALPPNCKEDLRRGGTHLVCTEEGVRFEFPGPPGRLAAIVAFPKADPSAGGRY